jgi:phage tail-like protein
VQRLQPLSARDPERGEIDLSGLLDAYGGAGDWTVYDIAFETERAEPRPVLGTLYAVGCDGRRALGFDLRLRSDDVQAAVRDDYLPLRRFSGGGLLSTSDGAFYDAGDRWLPVAVQPRRRYVSEGIVRTRLPLDGDEPGVTWHRVFLDACIPTSCSVQVESRSADTQDQLRAEPWQAEPALYQRPAGSEIPYDDPFGPDAPDGAGTWEVLLQQAEGRYLDLRLTLRGNGRATPRIQSLRAYAPRFSYLKEYLPDVYQQDPTSADFLERFLANPEGMFTALEGRIASAQVLFDTRTVPDDYLDWLGTWLGAAFDAAWEPERRRLFLDHAMDLYRRRGTVSGLLTLIDLALHPCPDATLFDRLTAPSAGDLRSTSGMTGVRVVESFRTRTQTALRLGDARQDPQPGLTSRGRGWTPSDGAGALTARFRAFLNSRYETRRQRAAVWPGMVPFPAVLPEDAARRADWRAFVEREIAVPYAEVDPGDAATLRRFRRFLARSTSASDRRAVYGTADVEAIRFPGTLPTGSRAYDNWMQFVSFIVPMQRQAHRFTVLVPSQPDEAPEAQQRRVNRVRRIVQQHRPAHTDADVQPFWALFRVGFVRVPYDTVLGESSRYAALVLGTTDLADGTLAAAHPFGVSNRRVTDRDAASSSTPL